MPLIAKINDSVQKLIESDDDIPAGWVKVKSLRPQPAHLHIVDENGEWLRRLPSQEYAYHQRICRYHSEVNHLLLAAIIYRLDGRADDANAAEQEALSRYYRIKNDTGYEPEPYRSPLPTPAKTE